MLILMKLYHLDRKEAQPEKTKAISHWTLIQEQTEIAFKSEKAQKV